MFKPINSAIILSYPIFADGYVSKRVRNSEYFRLKCLAMSCRNLKRKKIHNNIDAKKPELGCFFLHYSNEINRIRNYNKNATKNFPRSGVVFLEIFPKCCKLFGYTRSATWLYFTKQMQSIQQLTHLFILNRSVKYFHKIWCNSTEREIFTLISNFCVLKKWQFRFLLKIMCKL